jgi:hypothetical protein
MGQEVKIFGLWQQEKEPKYTEPNTFLDRPRVFAWLELFNWHIHPTPEVACTNISVT